MNSQQERVDKTCAPERNLCAKIIENAIRGMYRGNLSDITWFKSNSTEPFSFIWICQALETDPNEARKEILDTLNNKNKKIKTNL